MEYYTPARNAISTPDSMRCAKSNTRTKWLPGKDIEKQNLLTDMCIDGYNRSERENRERSKLKKKIKKNIK